MRARCRRKRRQKPCKPAFPRPGLTQRIRPLSTSRTSTYFEGEMEQAPKAKYGYSVSVIFVFVVFGPLASFCH